MTQIWTAFPFGNTIMKIEITGADLLAALEYGVADAPAPQEKFPKFPASALSTIRNKKPVSAYST